MLQIKQGHLRNIFAENSRIVLFGAGSLTMAMFEAYKDLAFEAKVDYIIDNDKNKDGSTMLVNGKEIKLVTIESFSRLDYKDYVLLVMPVFFLDIVKQIDGLEVFDNVSAYIYAFLMNMDEGGQFSIKHTEEMRIPKKIHYCWFGGNPIPDLYQRNIESWKKYCPDYEIIEWNESNYDIRKNQFMYQAYQRKEWAYVSDYARKDIIYNCGGIYFDTDVEVLKPLDELLYNEFFVGRDDVANIATGAGFGAVKGNMLMKELRDDYEGQLFVDSSGNIVGRVCGVYETALMVKHGYRPDNKCQLIEGGCVLPREVLCPISWIGMSDTYTEKTLTVHKYDDLLNTPLQMREIELLYFRGRGIDSISRTFYLPAVKSAGRA